MTSPDRHAARAGRPRGATLQEELLAERYTRLLDFLSRTVGALKDGSRDYLHSKLVELRGAAAELIHYTDNRALQFNGARTAALVSQEARHYEAGRLLFPLGDNPLAAARCNAITDVATRLQFGPPDGVSAQDAFVIANWLRGQAEKQWGQDTRSIGEPPPG